MSVSRLLVLSAMLMSVAQPAHAGCGGSSGSGSDDDSSSSCPIDWSYDDDDDDDGGARSTRRPVCVEVSDTVGESVCRRFGRGWDTSNATSVRLSISPVFRVLRLDGVSFRGEANHDDRNYQTGNGSHGLDGPMVLAGGANARLDVGFLDYFSAGVEASIVGGEARGPTRRDGRVSVTPMSLQVPAFGLNVGGAIPLGIVTLRPELHLGYRILVLRSRTRVGGCIDISTSSEGQGVVEPRLTAEVFVSPFISLAGTVGTNVLAPGEMYGALSLSLHSRAFDGQPR
ncbi:MAG: hypothetical protein AB8I08_16280 [Sandaracinaceae bacterium]